MYESNALGLTGPLVVAIDHDSLHAFEFAIVAEVFGLTRQSTGHPNTAHLGSLRCCLGAGYFQVRPYRPQFRAIRPATVLAKIFSIESSIPGPV
jgi:hypothetical protein